MIRTYCDKCGKELTHTEALSSIEIKRDGFMGASIQLVNLCKECREDFLNYIDNYFNKE